MVYSTACILITLKSVPFVSDPGVGFVQVELRHDVSIEQSSLDEEDQPDRGNDAGHKNTKLNGHEHSVGNEKARVLLHSGIKAEYSSEKGENSASNHEQWHYEKLDRDDFKHVEPVKAHQSRT